MKTIIVLLLIGAATAMADDIVTVSGSTFKNATITARDATSVNVSYDEGITRIAIAELSAETQKKYGVTVQPTPTPGPAPDPSFLGKWDVTVTKDKLDDSQITMASLDAEEEDGHRPTLIFKLQHGKLKAYISYPSTFIGHDTANTWVRLDDNRPEPMHWEMSTDGKAIFSRNAGELGGYLYTCHKFIVKVEPFQSTPITSTFILDGFANVARSLGITPHAAPSPTPGHWQSYTSGAWHQ